MRNIKLIIFFATIPAIALNDAPTPWQLGFQDPATPLMEGLISLHDHIMFFITLILVFVFYMLTRIILLFRQSNVKTERSNVSHSTLIEVLWTLTPAVILVLIAVPSFALLYAMDEPIDPKVTIKAVGHQWYWSYEYSDYETESGENAITFDSYMIPEDELESGDLRLLEVDNRVIVPINTHVNVVVTAADVLHSWSVPSLGVKMDAVPGRLNQISMFIQREGVFYGQCSEICGANHGFMPIVVQAVSLDEYVDWVNGQLNESE